MSRPFPIRRELVPPLTPSAPAGFAVVDEPLRRGLPHRIQLSPALAVLVVLPTGVVRAWRDADPAAVVSMSDSQLEPAAPAVAVPLRLILEHDGQTLAALAPIAGLRLRMGAVELIALAWRVHAGTVRGTGDLGSRMQLAWRVRGGAS